MKLQIKMPFVDGVMDLLDYDEIMYKALYLNIKRYEPWQIIEDESDELTVVEEKGYIL